MDIVGIGYETREGAQKEEMGEEEVARAYGAHVLGQQERCA